MQKLLLPAFTVLMLHLNSCKKSDNEISPPDVSHAATMSKTTDISQEYLYKNFARAYSLVANEQEVRDYVLAEVSKESNGDYEVLYMHIKSKIFTDGLSFEEKILNASEHSLTPEMLDADPLLSICMPVNIEKMTQATIPSVVYGDDEDAATIPGFDSRQQPISVDNRITPSIPYWVIRDNERYDYEGNLLPETAEMLKRLGDVTIKNTFDPPSQVMRFDNPLVGEYFRSYEILDLNKIESWAKGKPEVILNVVGNINNIGTDVKHIELPSLKRSSYGPGKIILARAFICMWRSNIQGNYLQYFFYEKDKDKLINMSFSLPNQYPNGQNFNYSSGLDGWHPNDDPMGYNNININDPFTILTSDNNLIRYSCADQF